MEKGNKPSMKQLLDFFDVLSDETRLRILVLLYRKELCVCEICEILELSQPKISRHLAKLRDTGLVRDERQNQWIFYYLNIEDEQRKGVIRMISEDTSNSPMLRKDLERLTLKEAGQTMCCRPKKEC